jgi:hypothetical protein
MVSLLNATHPGHANFATEISRCQPFMEAARDLTGGMPLQMHIALARPLLPSLFVIQCPARVEKPVRLMAAAFDEMNGPGGDVRLAYLELSRWLKETPSDALEYRRQEAELLFRRIGITFAVYGDAEAQERLIPFDVIPRIVSAKEWSMLERGLKQRVRALNMFLRDIYHGRDVLRANVIPEDLIFQNPVFRPEMNGQDVPHEVYVHVAGIDIVRINPENFSCSRTMRARRRACLTCWKTARS